MSDHTENIVTRKLVMLTYEGGKLTIEGPGWTLGGSVAKSARHTPGASQAYIDIRNDAASDDNGRDIFAAQRIPYTEFRLNGNKTRFNSTTEVVDYINNVESAPATFSRSVAQQSGSFTAEIGQIAVVDNSAGPVTVTLPSATAEHVGQDILLYCQERPQNSPVTVECSDASESINGISAVGTNLPKAVYNLSNKDYTILRISVVAENQWIAAEADSSYAALVFAAFGENVTPSSGEDNAKILLQGTGTADLLEASDFWFAMKFEQSPGVGEVSNMSLLSNGNAAIGWWAGEGRTHGATYLNSSNQNTLGGIETTTHGFLEHWVVMSYDSSAGEFSMWNNGVKVVDAATGIPFTDGVGTGLAISGSPGLGNMAAIAPIPGLLISSIAFGAGSTLTDAEVATLTPTVVASSEMTTAIQSKTTRAVTFDANGGVNEVGTGSIALGSLLTTKETALGA